LADGSPKPIEDKTDWARLRAMTDEEVTAAAMSDPDARPMTPEQLRTARRVPRTKTLRRALSLTQEEFAARYHIPIGTLRDWEQGLRSEPVRTGRTCASRRGRLTIKIKKRGGEGAFYAFGIMGNHCEVSAGRLVWLAAGGGRYSPRHRRSSQRIPLGSGSYLLRTVKNYDRLHGRRPRNQEAPMTTVTISLPESLKAFIDHQLATKGYGNVSEYFRSLLTRRPEGRRRRPAGGAAAGRPGGGADIPLTPEFWKDLKAEARGIAAKHEARKRP
jgi:putative transcriptional regulator